MRQHITVVPSDHVIIVDGEPLRFDYPAPAGLHAIQWHDGAGHMEFTDDFNQLLAGQALYNEDVAPFVALWEAEKARLAAEANRPPTPEEAAAAALAAAKAERAAAVAAITVTVDGMVFDGDETAQERMARTVTAATSTGVAMTDTTLWVLHDNTVAYPTITQLAQALRLAGEAQTAVWAAPYAGASA